MSESQIWGNIIAWALQITLLIGVGAALPAVLRLKSPGARLLYWQLLLATCLALPWVRPWQSEVIAISGAPVTSVDMSTQIAATASSSFHLPSLPAIALWVLAAGFAVRLAWLAIGLLKLTRYRRQGSPIPLPPGWTGAARRARLLLSEEVSGPVTFGFFRPVVLLPASFTAMSEAMQEAILFHELTHVARYDWVFTFAEELVRAGFWFHPAIWWVLGEIQLAREQTVDQAVIGMTQARESYVDALLAIAGVSPQNDLAPAPLFLRRRHLKQRVKGIIQEVRMSKTRVAVSQIAAVVAMVAAGWFITDAVPLRAQAQLVADAAGVTVNLNGAQLIHRTGVAYPAEALVKGVEGTVVVQVRLNSTGEVSDDAILSGPEELRKSVQQAVLNWHFDKSVASTTQVVNIGFVKPAGAAVAARPAVDTTAAVSVSAANVNGAAQSTPESQATLYNFMLGQLAGLEQRVAQTHDPADAVLLAQLRKRVEEFKQANAGRIPDTAKTSVADQPKIDDFTLEMSRANARGRLDFLQQQSKRAPTDQLAQQIFAQEKTLAELEAKAQLAALLLQQRTPASVVEIEQIQVFGISDSAKDQLLALLPVHAGDPWSTEAERRISDAARQFDSHLAVSSTGGGRMVRIFLQTDTGPVGPAKIGANVVAANLLNAVKPVYPPLAKAARAQGVVKFEVLIGKDGTVQDIKLVSGPPLLVQAAIDAVKQWVYKPTLLNGVPVEVMTTVDVNFALADGPLPGAQ